jgi:hypothetical protein
MNFLEDDNIYLGKASPLVGNSIGGEIGAIDDKYFFDSPSDRDAYFASNPRELKDKLQAAVKLDPDKLFKPKLG